MVFFTPLFTICSVAMTVMAMPRLSNITSENELVRRATISTSTTGTLDGYYYSLWMQANSGATLNVEAGSYSLTWSTNSVNVVGGIGWMPGSARVINYSGTFNSPGNGYLSVYGWTTNPLVEYYIVESYGSYNPATGLTSLGTVTSDGGTYNIYHNVRVNAPSIQGTTTFNQFLSVRTSKRVGGTVTTGNHFNAWASHGLQLGTHNEQILATEGYESSGSSSISISQGVGGGSPTSVGSTPTGSPGSGTAAHWGQCGGTGWTGPTTCAAPYTCQAISVYYSQCL